MKRHGFLTLIFAGFALTAVACDNTRNGLEQDTEEARDAGEKAGEATRDKADETGDRAREGASDAGRAVESAGERAGEAASGAVDSATAAGTAAAVTATIKSALIADDELDGLDIDVDTNAQTKTVVLSGTVENAQQKSAAEKLAREKAEGYTVVNKLTVR